MSRTTPRALAGLGVAAALATITTSAAADEPCPVNALDCAAVRQFSATADATSDALFLTSLLLPVGLELGRDVDDDSLRRGLAYGGALGATAVTALLVKVTVKRDRPYTHNRDPRVAAFARTARGNDHSFFSGHTAMAFAAATSGGLLQSVGRDGGGRYAGWALGGALAGATGVFRVRAGKHFPTDVLVGAAVGTAAGVGITLAVAPGTDLRWQDAAGLGGGAAVGAAFAALVPMPRDVILPLGGSGVVVEGPVGLTPMAVPGGGVGLSLSGQLR